MVNIFKTGVNSFRLNSDKAEQLNNYISSLPTEQQPKTLAEAVVYLTSIVLHGNVNTKVVEVNKTPSPELSLLELKHLELLGERLDELKAALEANLPKLYPNRFKNYSGKVVITEAELLELMLDYCERDPSSEFPFPPAIEPIVKRITQTDGKG